MASPLQQTQPTSANPKIVVTLTYFDLCLMQISLSRQLRHVTEGRHDASATYHVLLATSFLPLLHLCNYLSTEAGRLRALALSAMEQDAPIQMAFSQDELDLLIMGLEHYRIDLLMDDVRLGPTFAGPLGTPRLPPFSTENGKLLRIAPLIEHLCSLKSEQAASENPSQSLVQVEPGPHLIWQDRRTWSQVSFSQPVCPLFRHKGSANRYVVWRTTQEGFACRRVGKLGVQGTPLLYPVQSDAKAACERHYLTERWE